MTENSQNNKVIAIVGPTASGKTAYSIELAEKLEKLSFQENSPISYFGANSQENDNAIKTKLIEFCPKKKQRSRKFILDN